MAKKTKISQQDIEAFLDAVKGTKPISNRKVMLTKKAEKLPYRHTENEELPHLFGGDEMHPNLQPDDFITFKRESISDKVLRKLKKAQYNIEAKIDLHRLTVDEARIEVNEFIHACLARSVKVALIVHGKGMPNRTPVLKNQLNYWLKQVDEVLAFCSAQPQHGGNGALYVLYKNVNEEKFF